jgi:transposase InsO family protein
VQIDVKFVQPIPGVTPRRKHYQFTAIDDCTRLRVLCIYPACSQKTSIQFPNYVLARLPFPVQTIQTDNGAEFQSAFHYHALDKGVGHVYIRPRTHRLNGKVERSHRIDAEEFYRLLDGTLIDDAKIFKTSCDSRAAGPSVTSPTRRHRQPRCCGPARKPDWIDGERTA